MLILFLILSIATIVFLSIRFSVHPFLSLLVGALVFALGVQMPAKTIIASINNGFGGTLGSIGLVIVFGVLIGQFLEKSGGALVLAKSVISLIGKKRVVTAMGIIGYIVSIPVFVDSGFIILSSLNKSLSREAGVSVTSSSISLVLGLLITHTMIPPTPGPIAAAGILDANVGLVLMIGLPVGLLTLFATTFYASKISSSEHTSEEVEEVLKASNPPGSFKSFLPLLLPIILILTSSFIDFLALTGPIIPLLKFTGQPVIALGIGLITALFLPEKLEKQMLSSSGWVGQALKDAAVILLITGAGGAFGKVLQNSGIGDELGTIFSEWNLGLWLPFLLAASLKTAQGSSTVSLITAAAVLAPLMPQLGFESEMSKAMVVIAIGAGSSVVSHVNDSLFWIFNQLTGMTLKESLQKYSVGTLVLGITAILVLNLLSIFLS